MDKDKIFPRLLLSFMTIQPFETKCIKKYFHSTFLFPFFQFIKWQAFFFCSFFFFYYFKKNIIAFAVFNKFLYRSIVYIQKIVSQTNIQKKKVMMLNMKLSNSLRIKLKANILFGKMISAMDEEPNGYTFTLQK
jgi:hypothetical protein